MKFVNFEKENSYQVDFEVNKVMFFCFVGLVQIQPGIFLVVENFLLPSPLILKHKVEKLLKLPNKRGRELVFSKL